MTIQAFRLVSFFGGGVTSLPDLAYRESSLVFTLSSDKDQEKYMSYFVYACKTEGKNGNFSLNFRTMRKLSELYSEIFQNY